MDSAACSALNCRDMHSVLLPGPLPRQYAYLRAQPSRSGRAAAQLPGAAQSSRAVDGLDLALFTLIVDDIVLPSGETIMESLGGGGALTQAPYSQNLMWYAARTCHTSPT